jgi:hypothetical protein
MTFLTRSLLQLAFDGAGCRNVMLIKQSRGQMQWNRDPASKNPRGVVAVHYGRSYLGSG